MSKGKKILIVNDDAGQSFNILTLLESSGYQVFHASSGGDGFELAQARRPDLILIKPNLPDMPGGSLCKRLRDDPQLDATAIVQLAGPEEGSLAFSLDSQYMPDGLIDPDDTRDSILHEIESLVRARKKAAEETTHFGTSIFVRESGDRFQTFFDHAMTGMALISIDGQLSHANRALTRLLGYPAGKGLSGTPLDDLLPADCRERCNAIRRRMLEGELLNHQDNYPLLGAGGYTIDCHLGFSLVHDDQNRPAYFILEVRDLTSHKTGQNVLLKQANLLQSILDSMVDGVAVADAEGNLILSNPAAQRILGPDLFRTAPQRKSAVTSFYYPDLTTPYPENRMPLARASRGEQVDNAEIWVYGSAQAEPILISASARPLVNSNGEASGAVTVFNDITRRKRSDEALEVQSQVLKNMTEGVSMTDRQGFILFTNPAMERMFGYHPGELVGQHVSILSTYATEDNARLSREISDSLKKDGVWIGEMSNRHKDGRIFSTFSRISLLEISGSKYWVCVQEDITDRKRTEEALRQSEERFAKVFRASPVAVIISTLNDSRILDMNDSCLEWLGYERHEIIGHTMQELGMWQNPADLEEVGFRISDEHIVANQEMGFRTQGREAREALINAELIELSGEHCVVWIMHDITERKKTDAQIKASLKEKEVLLQEIHHRVKNNLQVISSLLNLQSNYIKDAVVRELFRESQDRVKSMALIHEKLYQSSDLARIDFSEYIRSLITMLFQSYRATANHVKLESQVQHIHLDIDTAIPVGLMINELVSNSLKHAFPESRTGTITIDLESVDDHFELLVRDNGIGVPANFNPEESTSLGLRLVRILTNQIGGQLEFHSDHNTEFRIRFQDTQTRTASSQKE